MKPQPSDLVEKRARDKDLTARVIREGDPGFDEIYHHAIVGPLFDAITTRLRFTPPDDLGRLIEGVRAELLDRSKGVH